MHGVGTSGHLWRAVVERVSGTRRCIALDLPGHGHTPVTADQDLSLGGLARFVADACAALDLGTIDLVANDTGGAVAQIVELDGARLFFPDERPDELAAELLRHWAAHAPSGR